MKNTMLIGMIALMLGVGIGFGVATLLESDSGSPPTAQSSKKVERGLAIKTPLDVEEVSDGRKSEPEPPAKAIDPKPEALDFQSMSDAQVREALSTYNTKEIEGVIRGTVQHVDGRPAEGVLIRADATLTKASLIGHAFRNISEVNDGSPPDVADQTQAARTTQNQNRALRARYRREVKTNAQGGFELSGLLDCPYNVRAYLKGYQALRPGSNYGRVKVGEELFFTLKPIQTVKVNVLLPDGSVPESALVSIQDIRARSAFGSKYTRWKKETRDIPFQSPLFRISAISEDGLMRSKTQSVNALSAQGGTEVTIKLETITMLKVELEYPSYDLLNTAHQVYIAKSELGELKAADLRASATRLERDRNFANSQYHSEDLEAGNYHIYLVRMGGIALVRPVVIQAGVAKSEKIVVPDFVAADFVVVTIEGLTSEDKAHLRFQTGYGGEGRSSSGSAHAVERPDGSYWIRNHSSSSDLSGGRYFVVARTPSHAEVKAFYDVGPSARVHLVFQPPAVIEFTLNGFDLTGEARRRAMIRLAKAGQEPDTFGRMPHGTEWQRIGDMIDDNGKFFLTGASAGEYLIELKLGNSGYSAPTTSTPITLAVGTNYYTMSMPTMIAMKIEFPNGSRGSARLYRGRVSLSYRNVPSKGLLNFGEMAVGEYRVEFRRRDGSIEAMTFKHDRADTILFSPNE